MRIRKLAKLSSLFNATSPNSVPQPHVCEFNQSLWDVITDFSPPSSPMFPPSPKVDGNGLSSINECFGASISLMEWKDCDDHDSGGEFDCKDGGGSGGGVGEEKGDYHKGVVLCSKKDGKNWQCKRGAKYGNSLCDHHLALASKNSSNQSSNKKKKSEVVVETNGGKRRVRTKKSSTVAANPHEIYYYSGFGPRWDKRRGEDNACDTNLSTKSLEDEPVNEPSSAKFMDEGLDYIEDDDDEEEDGFGKKKKARKLAKARSLKSLM